MKARVNMNNLPGPNILNQVSLSPQLSLSLSHIHEHPQASIKECLLVLLASLFPHLLVTSPFHGFSFAEWTCHYSSPELH